ncbi:Protein of unknown function DUF2800 [uncultured Caudovirales phage]|uniref:DUF2800 domain-containing protein n=1 Tax=uncultured Caudovirales phage TaxID=2100421 RepID=A0A6J5NQT1_9CAUD|nr:Protein of unknown function DUF2800 [uncultured Caudovirales phage]
MNHSNIVGGSTAKRVINCPASVALCAKMPPKPSSEHADRGTLLHNVIAELLEFDKTPEQCLGTTYKNQTLTQELIDEKIIPALEALDEIDPDKTMEYMVETRVAFGDFLPGVFGSTDLLGRKDKRAVVLDWKFGDGVLVGVEDNPQLLFYAAAAMRTPAARWVFEGVDEIECVIVQPPMVRRWVTTPERVKQFEVELARAVRESSWPEPTMQTGDHCRWCAAKPVCPQMNGEVDRALKVQLANLPAEQIALQLEQADAIESYLTDLRALAFQMLENGQPVPGYKLVAKQSRRQWVDENAVELWVYNDMIPDAYYAKLKSPAQMEKMLKKLGKELPKELVVSVSSGSTLAPDSDPRPAVLQLGRQMMAALSKLQ